MISLNLISFSDVFFNTIILRLIIWVLLQKISEQACKYMENEQKTKYFKCINITELFQIIN
jgi:hypothetical protein